MRANRKTHGFASHFAVAEAPQTPSNQMGFKNSHVPSAKSDRIVQVVSRRCLSARQEGRPGACPLADWQVQFPPSGHV